MRLGVTLALIGAVVTALGLTGSAAPAPKAKAPVKVTVTMTDFKFKLTNSVTKKAVKTVPKNRAVKFTVLNKGRVGHDFDIPGVKNMPVIAAGKRYTRYTVRFKKAGKYRFVCTVPLHAGNGMTGNLTVK